MQEWSAQLVEVEAGNADRGIYIVPLRRDVFVANLKIALLSRGEWRVVLRKQALFIPQHYLVERIVKFERNFNLLDAAIAAIFHRAKYKRHFLVQKIGRAAQRHIFNFDLRSVLALRGAEGWMDFLHAAARRRLPPRPQIKSHQYDDHGGGRYHQCEAERSALGPLFACIALLYGAVHFRGRPAQP